jgi:hypothetical protein
VTTEVFLHLFHVHNHKFLNKDSHCREQEEEEEPEEGDKLEGLIN